MWFDSFIDTIGGTSVTKSTTTQTTGGADKKTGENDWMYWAGGILFLILIIVFLVWIFGGFDKKGGKKTEAATSNT